MVANDLFKQSMRLARITLKAGRVPSTDQLAEALTAAHSMLYFNYTPDAKYQVELYQWKAFARFAAGTDTITFPPEYEEAIVYNLARRLAAIAGKQFDPDVRDIAAQSLADIETLNAPA